MRYPLILDSGKMLRKVMNKLMITLLKNLGQYEELETQAFTSIDVNRVRRFLEGNIKKIIPFVERRIKQYIKLTYKNGLKASVTTNETAKQLLPGDVKEIRNLQSYWINSFKSLTDELKGDVMKVVNRGINNNYDPRTIKSQLRNIFYVNTKGKRAEPETRNVRYLNRAEMVGRTLIVEGYNQARFDRDSKSGIVWGEEWLTSEDEKVCPICNGLDENIIKLGDMFSINYKNKTYEAKYPPIHIHCRCRMQAITYVQAKQKGLLE